MSICILFQKDVHNTITAADSPIRTPLATPGIPWISVTLLRLKYSLHVEFSKWLSQKSFHNLVVTVTLFSSVYFAQISIPRLNNVRFPRRQTLEHKRNVTYGHISFYFSIYILPFMDYFSSAHKYTYTKKYKITKKQAED